MNTNNQNFILPPRIRRPEYTAEERRAVEEIARIQDAANQQDGLEDGSTVSAATKECPECNKVLSSAGSLRVHLLKMHKKRVPAGKNGRPYLGGKQASNMRAYAKNKVTKVSTNKKPSKYLINKEKRKLANLAHILKHHSEISVGEKVAEVKSAERLGAIMFIHGGNFFGEVQASINVVFNGIGCDDNYYNRLALMEVILEYLVKCFPSFLNDQYDKTEKLLSFLSACDKDNLGKLPLGRNAKKQMCEKSKKYFSSKEGSKNMGRVMSDVLDYLHLRFRQFDFKKESINHAMPYLGTLFKGPWPTTL